MKFNKKKKQIVRSCQWPRPPFRCKECPIDKPHKHVAKQVPIIEDYRLKFIHVSKVVMK